MSLISLSDITFSMGWKRIPCTINQFDIVPLYEISKKHPSAENPSLYRKKTFFKTLRHCKLNAMYTLKSSRESCTKFTAFGYKYCIELSKRFCKLVVIYAVKEFCIKYLTCELMYCMLDILKALK